jgi:hypothetical protein
MADSSHNPTLRIEDLVVAPVSKRQAAAENVPPAIPEVDIKTDGEFSKKTEYSILSDGKALYIIPYVDDVNVSELRSKITEDLNNVDLHNIKLPNDPERSFAFVKERTATVRYRGKETQAIKVELSPAAHGWDSDNNEIELVPEDVVQLIKASKIKMNSDINVDAINDKLRNIRTYRGELAKAEAIYQSRADLYNFIGRFGAKPAEALACMMDESKDKLSKNSGNFKRTNNGITFHCGAANKWVSVKFSPNQTLPGNVDVKINIPDHQTEQDDIALIQKDVIAMFGGVAKGIKLGTKHGVDKFFASIPCDKIRSTLETLCDIKEESDKNLTGVVSRILSQRDTEVTESPATQFSRMTQRAARLDDILQETRRNAAAAMIIKHHVMAILDSGKDEVPPVTMQDLYASRQEAKRVIHRAVTIDDLARGDEGGMGLLAEIAERHTIAETLRRDRKSTQRG